MKFLLLIMAFSYPVSKYQVSFPANKSISASYTVDAIDDFWHWFKKNEQRLRNFESDPEKYLYELLGQAKRIKDGIAIELEPPKNGMINMTISADGNIELFELIRQIVAKAPVIKGWKIFAFRQRMPASAIKQMILKVGDLHLDPSMIKFLPVVEEGKLNIVVYVAGVNENNYNQVAYAGLTLIDNILGEYDCVMKVHAYDFHEFPEASDSGPVPKPLLELASFVDEFYKKR